MNESIAAAFTFPAIVFSFALIVVALYWVLVALGGLGVDVLDGDAPDGHVPDGDAGGDGATGGWTAALGLSGVPVTVTLSLLIALCWFLSLSGGVLLAGLGVTGAALAAASLLVLVAAVIAGWLGTRLLIRPLRRVFTQGRSPSNADFVGRMCVVRTGRVDAGFGQAEVTAADGSSAIVQVRTPPGEGTGLGGGGSALIYDYDPAGGFFLVMPYDADLDPDRRLP